MTDPLRHRLAAAGLTLIAARYRNGVWRCYLDWPVYRGQPVADISGRAWQVDGFTGMAGWDFRGGYVEIR